VAQTVVAVERVRVATARLDIAVVPVCRPLPSRRAVERVRVRTVSRARAPSPGAGELGFQMTSQARWLLTVVVVEEEFTTLVERQVPAGPVGVELALARHSLMANQLDHPVPMVWAVEVAEPAAA